MSNRYNLILLFILCLSVLPLAAQQHTRKVAHILSVDFRPGYITPTHAFIQGDNSAGVPLRCALSGHLKYAFRFNRQTRLGALYPYAYQGIGISYNSFSNQHELGNPVGVYVFQGSRIARLSSVLSLDYEWNFGASFGWKKYHTDENSYNRVIGSDINAYINLGVMFNWQCLPGWNLTAGVDVSHYSNGNTHYPNAGLNIIGGRIGVAHIFGAVDSNSQPDLHIATFRPHFSCDVVLYGAVRRRGFITDSEQFMIPSPFGIVGMNVNPMYHINRYFRGGISLDAQYDESANLEKHYAGGGKENPLFYKNSFRDRFSTGLSVRGEWVMPIFSINAGIGYNVIHQGEDTRGWYQILALKASLTRHLFLHIGYQLHRFKDPNNLMLGLGWRFEKRQKL